MKTGKTYCEASFWRPTGLGNRLFSWARCKLFSEETGSEMLSPSWAHLRGASITRGGINYRNAPRKILLFDNFKHISGEITGPRKYFLRASCRKIVVSSLPQALQIYNDYSGSENRLISFAGHLDHEFGDLWQHHDSIRTALAAMTKKKWLEDRLPLPYIGINVRMGKDFKEAGNAESFLNNRIDYLRTPLRWYIESLRFIRNAAGREIPAVVISDGTRADLKALLEEPSMVFPDSKSAIGDLSILSRASVLVAAGRSSFSAWASFLGQMPTVTIPGSSLQSFEVSPGIEKHYVGELDPMRPDEFFINAIKTAVNAPIH
jgi:hypothetical protein